MSRNAYRGSLAATFLSSATAMLSWVLDQALLAGSLTALAVGLAALSAHLKSNMTHSELRSQAASRGTFERSTASQLSSVQASLSFHQQLFTDLVDNLGEVSTQVQDLAQRTAAARVALGSSLDSTHEGVAGLTSSMNELNVVLMHLTSLSQDSASSVASTHSAVNKHAGELRKLLEELPSVADDYSQMRQRLTTASRGLPQLGGWALTTPMVNSIAQVIDASDHPTHVLELGSGGSSVWIGLALRASTSGGHCWSLEQERGSVARTNSMLADQDLEDWVTVLPAPLSEMHLSGSDFEWYSASAIPDDMPRVNLLLIDGPRGKAGEQVRYPALPALADRLAPGALIYFDDTIRHIEKTIMARWLGEFPSLKVVEDLGKGTLMRWH